MASALLKLTYVHEYACSWLYPSPPKSQNPIKIGVLSTASINPASIIYPAQSHPEVELYAIASREKKKAQQYKKRYKFKTSYGSYEELLGDAQVDLVYIATPNGLHFQWACNALDAGKHVLVEKPFTSNGEEAEMLVRKAEETGKFCMEAMHWQFHPAAHKFRQILDQHFGRIIMTKSDMTVTPAIRKTDVRWRWDMSGGSLMDLAYVVSFTRYALRERTPEDVVYAHAKPSKQDLRIDKSMEARLKYSCPEDEGGEKGERVQVYSDIHTDLARDWMLGIVPRLWELPYIEVETERAEIHFYNPFLPHLYHCIAVRDKANGTTTYENLYKGGPIWGDRGETHWATYRYQLEAVVDMLRGREAPWCISGQDSIEEMKTIDMVYKQSGFPARSTVSTSAQTQTPSKSGS
ncbi:putative NAD binding Rossmann fold oxidoreductase [Amanita muscaria]